MATDGRVTPLNNNAQLPDLPDAIYWPFKRLPELRLEAYAEACLEIALRYSEDARAIYTRVVQSWELPGCQVLIDGFRKHKGAYRAYQRDRARAVVRNQPLPDLPDGCKDVILKAESNADASKLGKYVGYLILVGFNRRADLENKNPKVLQGRSSYLAQSIVSASLLDFLEIWPELKGPRIMPDTELAEFRWFCHTLTGRATTRPSRQIRRTLRRHGFNLHHYQTIADGAEKWYKSRVNPGTIEAYLAELGTQGIYLDRGRIENDIAPCDEATGYPRKWRK